MKRAIGLLCAFVAAVGALVFLTGAAGEPADPRYTVELDNAFGLIEGADVKVAGVRAGKIRTLEINRDSYRARVGIEIKKEGFGQLRKDVFCETRPQSLIGEYYLDCRPGKSPEKLPVGSTIPVEQTGSTVPLDLITNIYREPYRERFSIILSEFGAALTARGEDLNETIRRASPALREVDRVLAQLAEQRRIIRDLTANAERVVGGLAEGKTEVTRFVREARDTAAASAQRKDALREQFQTFPTFLRELRMTMPELGRAADAQRGSLTTLAGQAELLTRFLNRLGPFSEASRPAFRTLAAAARTGRTTVRNARPRIAELGEFAEELPELATNARFTLEHLHDRDFATEKNAASPGGKGFTGFEAILQYVFRQDQAVNTFDDNTYLLKVSAFSDNLCANYTDAKQAREQRERDRCLAALGPGRPGIDEPDPSATGTPAKAARKSTSKKDRDGAAPDGRSGTDSGPGQSDDQGSGAGAPDATPTPDAGGITKDLQDALEDLMPGGVQIPGAGAGAPESPPLRDRDGLLDFLLGS